MAANPPPGSLGAEDLKDLSEEQRRKLLERNPHLEELFRDVERSSSRAPKEKPAPEPAEISAPATGRPGRKAAGPGAKDRPAARPKGASRRRTSPRRRLASRVVRETPGLPGPSATNLVLSFLGSTILVIGLVLLLGGGRRLDVIPAWLGKAADRLTSPTDPLF